MRTQKATPTPGPWEIVEDGENSAYIRRRIKTIWDHEASPVAWEVNNEADAHLISAAPELKLACEGALAALLLGPNVDKQQAIDYLREALAKARGEE